MYRGWNVPAAYRRGRTDLGAYEERRWTWTGRRLSASARLIEEAKSCGRDLRDAYDRLGREVDERRAVAVVDAALRTGLVARSPPGSRRLLRKGTRPAEPFDPAWLLLPVGADLVADPEWRTGNWVLGSTRSVRTTRAQAMPEDAVVDWAARLPEPGSGMERHYLSARDHAREGPTTTWAVDRCVTLDEGRYALGVHVVSRQGEEGAKADLAAASMRLGETLLVDFVRAKEHAGGRPARYLIDATGLGGPATERLASEVERYVGFATGWVRRAEGFLEKRDDTVFPVAPYRP